MLVDDGMVEIDANDATVNDLIDSSLFDAVVIVAITSIAP